MATQDLGRTYTLTNISFPQSIYACTMDFSWTKLNLKKKQLKKVVSLHLKSLERSDSFFG